MIGGPRSKNPTLSPKAGEKDGAPGTLSRSGAAQGHLFFGSGRQQDDFASAAVLGQCLCLSCVAQRKTTANRKSELAVAHIIGKFAHFGWIGLCQHARDLYGRVQLCRTLGQKRGISKSPSRLHLRK